MSSRKVLSTLIAGLVMASLATSLVAGTAAAAVDGHRIHHVHKTYATHRLYNYARPAPYAYDSIRRESYGHCIIPTAYSINGICW
jgi:hypothetical protein